MAAAPLLQPPWHAPCSHARSPTLCRYVCVGLLDGDLAYGKSARTGPLPGVTTAVQGGFQVAAAPPVFLLDTPGVLPPPALHAADDSALRLALVGAVKHDVVS